MSLVSTELEYTDSDVPVFVPMDANDLFLMGPVEGGQRLIVDRIIAILGEVPTTSEGTLSIGTNSPNYDNILPDTLWGLISTGAYACRSYSVLSSGDAVKSAAPETAVFLKVTKGASDEGGTVRVVLRGFLQPVE